MTFSHSVRYAILDLDSTLIYSRGAEIGKPFIEDERNFYVKPLSQKVIFQTTIRKHVSKFLNDLEKHGYRIIVWSAGVPEYVKDIISVVFCNRHIDYLLTKSNLIEDLKDLRVIKKFIPEFDITQARLIDDNPDHSKGQERYFVLVDPFIVAGQIPTTDEDDDLLKTLIDRINGSYGE